MDDEALIRPAAPADIPTLVDFRERMLSEIGSDDAKRLRQLRERALEWFPQAFEDGQALGWIAEREGEVVGTLSMTLSETQPQYRSPSGRTAHVYGLYVLPAERSAGIATRLVQTAVSHACEWGADIVTLHAADKARPLYERLGFVATKEMRLQFCEQTGDVHDPC